MNPNIILSGRQPQIMNALAGGAQAAQLVNNAQHQTAYRNALAEHGAGAMQGNQASLGAIAGFDPAAAQGLQSGRLQQDATRQRMDILSAQERRAAEQYAAGLDAQQAQAEAQRLEAAVRMGMGAQTPEQWDQIVTQMGQTKLVGEFGNREMHANRFMEMADILKGQQPAKPADEYGRYAAEEIAAGRQPLGRIEYAQAKKGRGFSVRTPDGTTVTYGGAGGDMAESPLQPSSPQAMLSSIDGILNDPALDTATGVLSFLQYLPGTPQRRFGARAAQLEGQAFLQAFESLKGGGQITEIEGQKATQAIGRLDTAQSPEDYRAALGELRGILAAGISRPQGWVDQKRRQNDLSQPMPPSEAQAMTVEQIRTLSEDDFARLPLGELRLSDEQWDALEARAAELGQ